MECKLGETSRIEGALGPLHLLVVLKVVGRRLASISGYADLSQQCLFGRSTVVFHRHFETSQRTDTFYVLHLREGRLLAPVTEKVSQISGQCVLIIPDDVLTSICASQSISHLHKSSTTLGARWCKETVGAHHNLCGPSSRFQSIAPMSLPWKIGHAWVILVPESLKEVD